MLISGMVRLSLGIMGRRVVAATPRSNEFEVRSDATRRS